MKKLSNKTRVFIYVLICLISFMLGVLMQKNRYANEGTYIGVGFISGIVVFFIAYNLFVKEKGVTK